MEKKNLAYLKDNLLYLGFGKHLYPELEKNFAQRFPEFILRQEALINEQRFAAALYFKRGGLSDLYFFNRWDAILQKGQEKRTQTFYLQKGYGITFKEAFNLLDGRAVYKTLFDREEQPYKAWLQLDLGQQDEEGNYPFRQFHERYGFHLEKTLRRLPIRELEREKAVLLRSLEKGNRAEVTLEGGGHIERLFVEAAPQYKTLNIYDHGGQRLTSQDLAQRFALDRKETPKAEVTLLGNAAMKDQKVVQAPLLFEAPKMVQRPAPSKGRGQSLL